MALPAPSTTLGDWSAVIAEVVLKDMKANISIFEPGADTAFNATADTGGVGAATLLSGLIAYDVNTKTGGTPARIQPIRQPTGAYSLDRSSLVSKFTVQIPLDATTAFIREGLIVVVNDGGKDKSLEKISLVVESAINSSDAAVRTIKCVSPVAQVGV